MKKYILSLAFGIVAHVGIYAQATFQGQAVYESKRSVDKMLGNVSQMRIGGNNVTPEMQERMKERMRKAFEKTYILNFDRTASTYKEEEKLEANGNQAGMRMMMASMSGGGGTYYKDVKDKTFTVDKEFMGKEFLVKDSLIVYKWQMSGETKKIGDYTVYKATAVIPVDGSDLTNFRPRANPNAPTSDKKEDDKTKSEGAQKTSFFSQMELPKEKTVTAWYTPEIPVNQGPEGYWGLPGLILEVNDGTTTIVCSKVVINPKEKLDIKAPKKGKAVSQKEFTETSMKKMEEMREQFQRGGVGAINIGR